MHVLKLCRSSRPKETGTYHRGYFVGRKMYGNRNLKGAKFSEGDRLGDVMMHLSGGWPQMIPMFFLQLNGPMDHW